MEQFPPPQHLLFLQSNVQASTQAKCKANGIAAGMTGHGMRSTSKASCQSYQAIGQATEGYQTRNVHRVLAFSGERRLLPCLTWTM
jgi:hypothetical protein